VKVTEIVQAVDAGRVPMQVCVEAAKSLPETPRVSAMIGPTVTEGLPAGTKKVRVVTLDVLPTFMPPKSTGPPGERDWAEAAEENPAKARRTRSSSGK
jgi:hypothetical protein